MPWRPGYDLSGAAILVNGRTAGRTAAGGSFFVGGLRTGIYRVELDPEKLPIELLPERLALNVEVAGGAVSRADFSIRVAFGIAGRVIAEPGVPVENLEVELVGRSGSLVASSRTDRFGFYRMDAIPSGTYTLRLVPSGPPSADPVVTHLVEILDDFLFGQDLVLPAAAAPSPKTAA